MASKSNALEKAQEEVKKLEKLKQEVLNKMPKQTNFLTKELVKLLEKQLDNLDSKLQKAKKDLEEAVNASDLVNMEALEKIAKDAANGKTDALVETAKDIAKDKAGDVIDKTIKDKELGGKIKDVVSDVSDGNMDGALDKVQEGAKDEAGNLIDKHVKDDKIAGTLKDVVGDVVEGDFKGALDKAKEGAKEIIEEKIDDLVGDLLAKFEKEILGKITGVIEKEVGGLIAKALEEVRKKVGTDTLVGQFVTNITKRLEKDAGGIIKSELDQIAKSGALKDILKIAKDAALAELKGGLKGRKIDDILKGILENIVKSPDFKKITDDLKRRLLGKFVIIVEQELEKTVGPVLDKYLEKYGNWKGELVNTGKKTAMIGPFWGCVNIALSIDAYLAAELVSKRKNLGATATGTIKGTAYAGVGISLGFEIPVVGKVVIEGGIQGGPELTGKASIGLWIKDAVLYAKMDAATINIDMSARIYLETPIPNSILSYVPDYVPSVTVNGKTLYYPLGRVNILIATTPSYLLSFDIVKGKYNYTGAVGNYSVDLNPTVKQAIKDTKDAITKAAERAKAAVNPTNWDLNPFDSQGWIGRHF